MKKKEVIKAGILIAILIATPIGAIYTYGIITIPQTVPGEIDGGNDGDADGDGSVLDWYVKQEISSEDIMLSPLGEFSVPAGETGWLSAFHLDYGQVPETVLANNATDWSTDANARGYVDADDQETDLKSEDLAYICVRVQHNDTAKDSGAWNYSRFRCKLTVSGDETISGVYEYDNSSSDGDAVISDMNVADDIIYINYWWDDGVDGYRITDDGTLTWAIVIEERY